TTTLSNVQDFEYKNSILKIEFFDGAAYEYFDVPRAMYIKLVNADSPGRFARRHIFNAFPYRNVAKIATA
ncbi:MAG: KTSC domain-containing protein, partial [Chitinophagaceae bacterium]